MPAEHVPVGAGAAAGAGRRPRRRGPRCPRSTTPRWTATRCAPPTSPAPPPRRRSSCRSQRTSRPDASTAAAAARHRSPDHDRRAAAGRRGRRRAGGAHRRRRSTGCGSRPRPPRASTSGARARTSAAGDVVLPAGTVLAAPQIGVAAAVGCPHPAGPRRPRVLVLSTGSELVAQARRCSPGRSTSRTADAGRRGRGRRREAELLRFVPDDVEQFLGGLADGCDGAWTCASPRAGSARGLEVVKDAFTGRGRGVRLVAMQPGGPQGAGRPAGRRRCRDAAGQPGELHVSFEVFVRPRCGPRSDNPHPAGPWCGPRPVRAGLPRWARGPAAAPRRRRGTVRALGGPASHLLASLARAHRLVVVPEEVTELPEGAPVETWLLDGDAFQWIVSGDHNRRRGYHQSFRSVLLVSVRPIVFIARFLSLRDLDDRAGARAPSGAGPGTRTTPELSPSPRSIVQVAE